MSNREMTGESSSVSLEELKGHVINLNEGQLSEEGVLKSSKADVDAIFQHGLPQAYQQAREKNKPLKIMFYVHGGLVSEEDGLEITNLQLEWWKQNGVYPIFFVWETGLLETIGQLLNFGIRGRETRDIADHTIDPFIEKLCRSLGVRKIWSGMKFNAQEAHKIGTGGAWYAATQLADFIKQHPDTELHAGGHSAGSIFHSHFIPCCLELGIEKFTSLQFLAPAITNDAFHERLSDRLGNGIQSTTIFTMRKALERDDNLVNIYHKSLLYLVSRALESRKKMPVLGLEESVRNDSRLMKLFGLDGSTESSGEIIWSKSDELYGKNACVATTHAGFDNEPLTMNSVMRRVLDISDDVEIVGFPENSEAFSNEVFERTETDIWSWSEDDEFDLVFNQSDGADSSADPSTETEGSVNKRALCIGINQYPNPAHVLYGCVADAHTWANKFKELGFSNVDVLLDGEATREGILEAIKNLIAATQPGDSVVIQYSGHGTQVTDYDFDERMEGVNEGQNDGLDEALCPVDFENGKLIIDDDLKEIFQDIPDQATVTGFYDCCHSATISRGLGRTTAFPDLVSSAVRMRTVTLERYVESKHREFREALKDGGNGQVSGRNVPVFKEVTFSACRASEVALERNGQGDFTRYAMKVLNNGIEGMSNAEFLDKVIEAFGENRKQNPNMDSSHAAMTRFFLV